eukprot:1270042-Rhodomonas_salina.2
MRRSRHSNRLGHVTGFSRLRHSISMVTSQDLLGHVTVWNTPPHSATHGVHTAYRAHYATLAPDMVQRARRAVADMA